MFCIIVLSGHDATCPVKCLNQPLLTLLDVERAIKK